MGERWLRLRERVSETNPLGRQPRITQARTEILEFPGAMRRNLDSWQSSRKRRTSVERG
jgi:hypothetical protein